MAFRMLPNGVVEVDTIGELRQLQGKRPERQPRNQPRASNKSAFNLSDTTKRFLLLLLRAPQDGLNTAELAERLKLESRGIPPLVRGVATWCRDKKLDRDKLLTTRMDYVDRKPVTVYKLTDQGKTTFGPMAAEQVANLNGKEAVAENHG